MFGILLAINAAILWIIFKNLRGDVASLARFRNFVPAVIISWFWSWAIRWKIGLSTYSLSNLEFDRFFLFVTLIAIAAFFGSRVRAIQLNSRVLFRNANRNFGQSGFLTSMTICALGAIGIGLSLFLAFSGEMFYGPDKGGGLLPILVYFSRIGRIVFLYGLVVYHRRKSRVGLLVVLLYLLASLCLVFVLGRRSEVIFLLMSFLSFRLYVSQKAITVARFVPQALVAMAVVVVLPYVRDVASELRFSDLQMSSVTQEVATESVFKETDEIYQCILDFNAGFENHIPKNWGLSFVNYFNKQFVSSALFGQEIKDRLTWDFTSERKGVRQWYGKGTHTTYISHTLVLDLFWEFGLFAIPVFFVFCWLMSSLEQRLSSFESEWSWLWLLQLTHLYFHIVYDSLTRLPTLLVLPMFIIAILPKTKK